MGHQPMLFVRHGLVAHATETLLCDNHSMTRTLKDMVVVVTGASAGIGKALCEHLDKKGATLVLSARREDRLTALNQTMGSRHFVVPADVSKQEDCFRLIESAVQRFGRIDTLVCNAGYGFYAAMKDTPPARVREIFQTNVYGTTDCIAAALPGMMNQPLREGFRAQVMIVSSFVARRSVPCLGPYAATKAAQLSIAEALRVELCDKWIAVTTVHPIMTRTEFGVAAEAMGEIKLPRDGNSVVQTVDHVAARMVAGIRRPGKEVWPSRPSRWLAGLATFVPGLVDRALLRYFHKLQQANPSSSIND